MCDLPFACVVNLTLVDLPGLTKVAVEGHPESTVQDIESFHCQYVDKVLLRVEIENAASDDSIERAIAFLRVL
ncbi:dynamin GTPase [Trifolium repens]|nr:dynamin GTPase [Trifolium repens]